MAEFATHINRHAEKIPVNIDEEIAAAEAAAVLEAATKRRRSIIQ